MKKKWKSWLLLAAPYLLCALLPVISVLFLEKTVLTNYQEKMLAEQQSGLQIAFNGMIQKIDNVENLSSMLSTNDLIEQYAYSCLNHSGHSTIDMMAVQDLIANAKTNSLIHDIFLYDTIDHCVVSTGSAVSQMSVFYRFSYVLEGLELSECANRLASLPRLHRYCPAITLTLSQAVKKEIVEYRIFLPVGWVREAQTQLVISMDAGELFREFRSTLDSGGEFYVYDSTGTLIYSQGSRYADLLPSDSTPLQPIETDTETLYGAVLRSQDGKWTVKVCMPTLLDNGALSVFSPAFLLFVILPMFACVLLTVLFTHKNYRGILELVDLFRSHAGEHPQESDIVDYRLVQQYAGKIIEEKNRADRQATEYAGSRKYEVLDKLIRNTYRTREEAIRMLEQSGLCIRPDNNLVLCACCQDFPEGNRSPEQPAPISDRIRQLLAFLPNESYELLETSATETVCVISLTDSDPCAAGVQEIVSNLDAQIQTSGQTDLLIGAGDPAESLEQLSRAYEQAKAVICYRELSGNRIVLYSDLALLESLYFFPKEFDKKILDCVMAGNSEEAARLIHSVYEENYVKNPTMLSLWAMDAIKARLWNCVLSVAEKFDISPKVLDTTASAQTLRQIRGETNAKRYFALIREKIALLTEIIQSRKPLKQNRLATQILEYVQNHFCEQEFSLKQISQALGIHENYISNLFKDAFGENLSVCVEKLRIEKACNLMDSTHMKIEEIATAVGYAAGGTFRRAFKKHKGISPAEYRSKVSRQINTSQ